MKEPSREKAHLTLHVMKEMQFLLQKKTLKYIMHGHWKKEGKDQESIVSSTTLDPEYQWESATVTIRHHKREPRGQPFPSR